MGTFILMSAVFLAVLIWNFMTVFRERHRRETALYLCVFLLAWAAVGIACLADLPSIFSLVFGHAG